MPSGEHPFDGDMILIKNKNKNKGALFYLSYNFCLGSGAVNIKKTVIAKCQNIVASVSSCYISRPLENVAQSW